MKKKILAILLVGAMLCSFATVRASAESDAMPECVVENETTLLEEAMGYLAEARAIFYSGTFTIKLNLRRTGKPKVDVTSPQVWVYDAENNQKLLEFDSNFFTLIYDADTSNIVAYPLTAAAAAFRMMIRVVFGSQLRAVEGTQRYIVIPKWNAVTADASKFGPYLNFYEIMDLNVSWEDVDTVEKEGNRITMTTDDGRTFGFTDGAFTYYKKTGNGFTREIEILSLSPEADQSYFKNEGLKVRFSFLFKVFDWIAPTVFKVRAELIKIFA